MCAMLFFFFFNLRSSRLQFLTQYIKLNAILVFCQLAYFLPLIALILEYWCKIWEWRGIIQICHFFTLPPWLQFMKQWEFREKNQERTFLILFQRTQWKAEEKKKKPAICLTVQPFIKLGGSCWQMLEELKEVGNYR